MGPLDGATVDTNGAGDSFVGGFLAKLALDSMLGVHWTIDSRAHGLSDWQVGTIGTLSAWLGLRLQWRAHGRALEAAADMSDGDDYETDDDGDEKPGSLRAGNGASS